ncbi:MAG: MerR family transcriptional regulator [Oscillospiraceae bacterium]|nr:MerR family transcriptional regulator [Oscillospiraceae bacterium]
MLINEACKRTGLTKKAIGYYVQQELITPSVSENGYRDYSEQDVEALNKISVLRGLGISAEETGRILKDTTNAQLQAASVRKELDYRRDQLKKSMLERLAGGEAYEEIGAQLRAVEQSRSITDKLLDAFPGWYGRFVCLHFARFLGEPIRTEDQKRAYETVLSFLDNLPDMDIPKDLEAYLIESTQRIGADAIAGMLEATKRAYENPDEFLADNEEMLERYAAYKSSDAYRNSPACRLLEYMKGFNSASGYNDVFIPAMKRLSASYADYYCRLESADKKLLERYPEREGKNGETE